MFDELVCASCELEIVGVDEPNCCMRCGEPLCDDCYDKDSYCTDCGNEIREAEAAEA